MPVHLSVAGRSDVGRCRTNNEDALVVATLTGGSLLRGDTPRGRFDVGERGVLLAVSDGMGGAAAGEVASALVVESLARALADSAMDAPADAIIKEAVQKAHREVWEAAHHPGREGMGATLTAVFVQACGSGAAAFIAEVGDSRAYLLRAGTITRLTKDQSYVQLLVDSGVLDPKEVAQSPLRNVILQAMGHQRPIDVALGKLDLRGRDCLLLCSDGLTNAISDEEIRNVVLAAASLEQAVDRLIDLANERGGEDNITVLTAGVGGDLAPAKAGEKLDQTFEILASFQPHRAF